MTREAFERREPQTAHRLERGTDKGRRVARVLVDRAVSGEDTYATAALLRAGFDRADLPLLWAAALARREHYQGRIDAEGYSPDAAVGAAFLDGIAIGITAAALDAP